MKNTLILTEKPSVAMTYAAVLGATNRREGYMDGNGYIISWCYGHLAELSAAESYDEKYAKWRYDDLPILPDLWKYNVCRDKKKQFDIVKKLMNSADVDTVVNACDAGREGELIFRTVYNLAGCKKPMKRLWISSMEDDATRDGFRNLRSGSDYDNLYKSALCRAEADWTVGINATRLFSVLYHRTLNVGRVISPTLALIVQRECEIDSFKPELFYTVNITGDGFIAATERLKDKSDAEAISADCKNAAVIVKSIERKEKAEKAPALYDLTTLQRDANRLLGYTAQQTLDYSQSLYEMKLISYPRTDSRFLTDDMVNVIPALAAVCASICGADIPESINAIQVCDSKKVSDHHAIVPTIGASKTNADDLLAGEREILRLIARQLLCAVSEPYRYSETVVTFDCAGHTFTAKGKSVICSGWKIYIKEENDKEIPDFIENQDVSISDVTVKEGKTSAPSHFTEDTLLSAMETAGAKETIEDAERKGLGTPATRAAILEKLVLSGFIERKKTAKTVSLIPTHNGNSLITVLPEQLQSPLLTAEWENKLKMIEHGELSPDKFSDEINAMVTELVKTYRVIKGAEVLFPSGREIVGKCPRCGGDVTESKKGFFCESTNCHFGLWRDNKFLTAKKIVLTKKLVSELLDSFRTHVCGIYSDKTGKTYDADILLSDDGEKATYKIDFGGKS